MGSLGWALRILDRMRFGGRQARSPVFLSIVLAIGSRLAAGLAHMRIEDDRLQNLVRVAQRAFGAFVSQTARTVDLLGGKNTASRPMRRDNSHSESERRQAGCRAAGAVTRSQTPGLIAACQLHPGSAAGSCLGDRLHGKQGFEVAALQWILQAPEKRKQRGS